MKIILKYLLPVVILSSCSSQAILRDRIKDNLQRSVYVTDNDYYSLEFNYCACGIVEPSGDVLYLTPYSITFPNKKCPEGDTKVVYSIQTDDTTYNVHSLIPPDSIIMGTFVFRLKGII